MATTITLERDGHDQPWGFRLQGGVDVGIPLSVQRVLVGTPAEGVLLKGDVITKISQTEAKSLTHQQAADLFNNAGNQIAVSIKRSGHSGGTAPVVNGTSSVPSGVPASPPVSGGVALPGLVSLSTARSSDNPALASLPQTQFMLKSDLPTPPNREPTASLETLSIQNQPYRTTPLITPGAKVKAEIGTGSMQHLKMQEDHITGVKEPQYVPVPQSVVRNQKANEILMKQKVRRPASIFLQGRQGGRGLQFGGGGAELNKVRRHTISTASPIEMLERHNRSGRNEFVKYGDNKYMVFGEVIQLKRVTFPVGEKVNKKESFRKFSSPANFPSLQKKKVSMVKPVLPPLPSPIEEIKASHPVIDKVTPHPAEEKAKPSPTKDKVPSCPETKKEKFAELKLLGTVRYEELEPDSKTIFRISDDERRNLDYLVDANCKNQDAEFTFILPSCAKKSPENKLISSVEVVGNICISV